MVTDEVSVVNTVQNDTDLVKIIRTRGWALDRVHNSRRPLDRFFALCELVGELSW